MTKKDAAKRTASAIVGASGEHYVAGYLSGLGLIVAMPRAGIPGCDLLVSSDRNGRALRLQVKTGRQATRKTRDVGPIYLWETSYSTIDRNDKHLWYAYIYLNGWPAGGNLPEVFFVPSSIVVTCMKQCRANKETRPFFWMLAKDATKYKGSTGLRSLLKTLNS